MNPLDAERPPTQDAAASAATDIAPSIVSGIPVKESEAVQAPAKEDAELDRIMQDVGQQLKAEDKKPTRNKKRLGLFKRKPEAKKEAKLHAQPLTPRPIAKQDITPPPQPPTAQTSPLPPRSGGAPPQPPAVKDTRKPAAGKTSSVPVLAITVALIITAVLIGAAFYTYKK